MDLPQHLPEEERCSVNEKQVSPLKEMNSACYWALRNCLQMNIFLKPVTSQAKHFTMCMNIYSCVLVCFNNSSASSVMALSKFRTVLHRYSAFMFRITVSTVLRCINRCRYLYSNSPASVTTYSADRTHTMVTGTRTRKAAEYHH